MQYTIIIPTYNGGDVFKDLLVSIFNQSILPQRTIIIDSGSTDNTLNHAEPYPIEQIIINKTDFGHGKFRAFVADKVRSPYSLLLTQDAILHEDKTVELLLEFISDTGVAAAYGRQIPHQNASAIAKLNRDSNYGSDSYVISKKNTLKKPIFFSNSFAIYDTQILLETGNFDVNAEFGEDVLKAMDILDSGYTIGYCSEAKVRHSHNYTLAEDFKRMIEVGKFHRQYANRFKSYPSFYGHGRKVVMQQLINEFTNFRF